MKLATRLGELSLTAAMAALLTGAAVAPVAAKPDPGDPPATQSSSAIGHVTSFFDPANCPLRRIDRQLVRGDILTGFGVPAPVGIAELESDWYSKCGP